MKRTIIVVLFLVSCSKGSVDPPIEPRTCTHVLAWKNPTEDVDGGLLGPNDLIKATLYASSVDESWSVDIPAYVVLWEVSDVSLGDWHYELTVSSLGGESLPDTVEASCT